MESTPVPPGYRSYSRTLTQNGDVAHSNRGSDQYVGGVILHHEMREDIVETR